jgi:hypothetical protein
MPINLLLEHLSTYEYWIYQKFIQYDKKNGDVEFQLSANRIKNDYIQSLKNLNDLMKSKFLSNPCFAEFFHLFHVFVKGDMKVSGEEQENTESGFKLFQSFLKEDLKDVKTIDNINSTIENHIIPEMLKYYFLFLNLKEKHIIMLLSKNDELPVDEPDYRRLMTNPESYDIENEYYKQSYLHFNDYVNAYIQYQCNFFKKKFGSSYNPLINKGFSNNINGVPIFSILESFHIYCVRNKIFN